MTITKELLLKSIQEMPDKFSIEDLLDKLMLTQKIEEGLQDLKNGNLVSLEEAKKLHAILLKHKTPKKKFREFGSMKGLVAYMAPDFNAPLDEFKDYM